LQEDVINAVCRRDADDFETTCAEDQVKLDLLAPGATVQMHSNRCPEVHVQVRRSVGQARTRRALSFPLFYQFC